MGTLGKGRSTGSNAQYDISNLHFYRDGEDIGIAEFFGVDSSSIDKASTMVVATLTTPKKAAKGNLIGTWGFSAKAAGLTIYRNADDYADWRYVDRQHEIRR